MCITAMIILTKTFVFLRVFQKCSVLTKMLVRVTIELKSFLLFFLINLVMLSQFWAILDIANFKFNDDPVIRALDDPTEEYLYIGRFIGNIMTVIRLTAAKSEFGSHIVISDTLRSYLFWICWTLTIFNIMVILLNFIIAEVSSIYETVNSTIIASIYQERISMIKEAENFLRSRFGDDRLD